MPHHPVTFRQMIQGCHHLHAHMDLYLKVRLHSQKICKILRGKRVYFCLLLIVLQCVQHSSYLLTFKPSSILLVNTATFHTHSKLLIVQISIEMTGFRQQNFA